MTSRWRKFAWAAGILLAVLVAACWNALTHRAERQTESLLDYAMLDLDATFMASIDTMLMHAAESVVSEFGRAVPATKERMALVAEQRDMDEVNVVGADGTVLASTDGGLIGASLADTPESAEFMVLANGARHAFSQPFRHGAHNPEAFRKYVGVAFPEGGGFVQLGLDETRVRKMFPSIMDFIFDGWLLGEKGFFLCADMESGRLLSNPARHRDEARFLRETGYDPGAPGIRTDGRATFRMRLFGDVCDCRATVYCGHLLVAALPKAEFYGARTFFASVVAAVLSAVAFVFVLLVRRIDIASARLAAFYAEEDRRREREMAVAGTIQAAALPSAVPAGLSFRIDAAMQAAKQVGGDFYDYFPLDGTHIAFLVADVSGKGIAAALYMMTAKTLVKDALLAVRDPAAALTKVNAELCRNNPAGMFVTAWVGVIDLETGVVSYANAGHNPPVALPSAAFVAEKSGPVLAFLDNARYKSLSLRLAPGEGLFLYTDGVTEAMDSRGALFGESRLVDAIKAAQSSNEDPASETGVVRAVVAAFSEGVPQADDITVMAVRYVPRQDSASRSFPPTQEGVASASAFLDEMLAGDPAEDLSALHVILDEICSNIVKHSGATAFDVGIERVETPPGAKLTFIDDGLAFDPLARAEPDTTLPMAERPIGGLGIMMVKRMASSVSYRRAAGRNFFTVVRSFAGSKE